MTVEVNLEGIAGLARYVERFPAVVEKAAALAVAEGGRFAFRESSKEIRSQVAFTRDYIGGEKSGGNRLKIERGTRGGDPFVRIVGRDRPTSLARFVRGTITKGKPVRLMVKPGRITSIPGAFPVRLRRGKTLTEDNFNQGLAIRLPRDAALRERKKGTSGLPEIFPNVFLLYGPSVAQVFNSVSNDVKPRISRKMASEFTRQFTRLLNGR